MNEPLIKTLRNSRSGIITLEVARVGELVITGTSLALYPDREETLYKIMAYGKGKELKRIESNLPRSTHSLIDETVRERSYMVFPSMYYPNPGTMFNLIGLVQYLWGKYTDKLNIEIIGDIGTIPYEKGVTY